MVSIDQAVRTGVWMLPLLIGLAFVVARSDADLEFLSPSPAAPTVDDKAVWMASQPGVVQIGHSGDRVLGACELPGDPAEPVLVLAYNSTPSSLDLHIEVELVDAHDRTTIGRARFPELRAGELRYEVPGWTDPIGPDLTRCRVLIVEEPNQLVIANGHRP